MIPKNPVLLGLLKNPSPKTHHEQNKPLKSIETLAKKTYQS
jgi:hypothetical protein